MGQSHHPLVFSHRLAGSACTAPGRCYIPAMANPDLEAELRLVRELYERALSAHATVAFSNAWKAVRTLYRVRDRMLPPGTRRRTAYQSLVRMGTRTARSWAWWTGHIPGPYSHRPNTRRTYRNWIRANEPTADELARQRIHRFTFAPSIGVLVGDGPDRDLTFASVREQTYSNARLGRNADFVCVLAAGELLAPFALFEAVVALRTRPDADFVYSDEDEMTPVGERVNPRFKTGWSPEAIRCRNVIGRPLLLKRELLDALGDWSSDYDLTLKASERARAIIHVPQVLVHRPAGRPPETDSAPLTAHLARCGIDAAVEPGPASGIFRTRYRPPRRPLVSVIVPNRDQPELLERCIASLRRTAYAPTELLVVENGSTRPETFALYGRLGARVLTWDRPFNYAAVNNYAATHASGELLLFLNNDVEAIHPDWLERMVGLVLQPGVAAVGAKLFFPDDTIQHAGVAVGIGGLAAHTHLHLPRSAPGYDSRLLHTQNLSAVTGACLLVRRDLFDRVGGFDEGYALCYNDIDLCLKLISDGHRIAWTPDAELYHHESKTRGAEDSLDKKRRWLAEADRFAVKWAAFLRAGDPYYGPHFRTDRADFHLR